MRYGGRGGAGHLRHGPGRLERRDIQCSPCLLLRSLLHGSVWPPTVLLTRVASRTLQATAKKAPNCQLFRFPPLRFGRFFRLIVSRSHHPLMQITGSSRATLRASPARAAASTTASTSL